MADDVATVQRRSTRLVAWGLGAFHTALLVVLVVGSLYAVGAVGDLLDTLATSIGVVAYLYLWAVVWWTNRRWLDEGGSGLVDDVTEPDEVVGSALKWGGFAGALVFLPQLLIVAAFVLTSGSLAVFGFLIVAGVIGVGVAFGVGALVGAAFALLDLLLLRVARAWLDVAGPNTRSSAP